MSQTQRRHSSELDITEQEAEEPFECSVKGCDIILYPEDLGYYELSCKEEHKICMACALDPKKQTQCDACDQSIEKITPVGFHTDNTRRSRQRKRRYREVEGAGEGDEEGSSIVFESDGVTSNVNLSDGDPLSDKDKTSLLSIFKYLHEFIVKPDQSRGRKTRFNPNKDVDQSKSIDDQIVEIIAKDDSFLLKCIKNLALGKRVDDAGFHDKSNEVKSSVMLQRRKFYELRATQDLR